MTPLEKALSARVAKLETEFKLMSEKVDLLSHALRPFAFAHAVRPDGHRPSAVTHRLMTEPYLAEADAIYSEIHGDEWKRNI